MPLWLAITIIVAIFVAILTAPWWLGFIADEHPRHGRKG